MIRLLLAELRAWPAARRRIALGAGVGAGVLLALTGSLASSAGRVPWWAWAVVAAGALMFGLTFATFRGAPVGAEPVVCDLRWPVLGFVGLSLATEQVSAVPMLDPLAPRRCPRCARRAGLRARGPDVP